MAQQAKSKRVAANPQATCKASHFGGGSSVLGSDQGWSPSKYPSISFTMSQVAKKKQKEKEKETRLKKEKETLHGPRSFSAWCNFSGSAVIFKILYENAIHYFSFICFSRIILFATFSCFFLFFFFFFGFPRYCPTYFVVIFWGFYQLFFKKKKFPQKNSSFSFIFCGRTD